MREMVELEEEPDDQADVSQPAMLYVTGQSTYDSA